MILFRVHCRLNHSEKVWIAEDEIWIFGTMTENVPTLNGNGAALSQELEPHDKAKENEKPSFQDQSNAPGKAAVAGGVSKDESSVEEDLSDDESASGARQEDDLNRADARLSEVSSQVEETSDEEDDEAASGEDAPRTPPRNVSDDTEDKDASLRRSTRSRRSTSKYVNYQDHSSMSELESDYSGKGEEEEESTEPTIEKFLGRKPANKALMRKCIEKDEQYEGAFLYLCKYKSTSYLHLQWQHEEELRQVDWRLSARLQRFATKTLAEEEERAEEVGWAAFYEELQSGQFEFFDPELTEVDRILAEKREIFEEDEASKHEVDLKSFALLGG